MQLSLNVIVAFLVASIALIVAATCVSISLLTSLNQIDAVGVAWASGMATGVSEKLKSYIDTAEHDLLGGSHVAQTQGGNKFASDLAKEGKNWTLPYVIYLQQSAVKFNFKFISRTVLFDDFYWMYAADSRRDRGNAFVFEWIEAASSPPTDSSVGGLRIWKGNSTIFPYDATDNYRAEAYYNQVYLAPMGLASFSVLRTTIAAKFRAGGSDPAKPSMFWLSLSFGYFPDKNAYWEQFGAAAIVNTSGTIIGYSIVSLGMDREMKNFLATAPRSQNGNSFLVDKDGYMLSTTYSAPFFTITNTTPTFVAPNGCGTTSSLPNLVPTRMGCRFFYYQYDYAPLSTLPSSFVLTATRAEMTNTVDGKDYIVISNRFESTTGSLRFNVLVFVPRDDLLGKVNAGMQTAIGIAAAIVVGAVVTAIIISYFTLKPLSDIAAKMEKTARLEGLDKDEVLEDQGDDNSTNGGKPKNQNSDEEKSAAGPAASQTVAAHSTSMIQEIATLELAYAFSHNQLVNFTRYVSKSVVKEVLMKQGEDLQKMEPTQITCSFADIYSFTNLCEKIDAAVLSTLLHAYFKRMTRLVMAHGGIIDRFIGDCIMGVWGAPFKISRHELLGALCGLAFQRETNKNPLRQIFADVGFPLSVRVGVASGHVLAGNIGSSQRQAYTVIGETVQTADKLESYNKKWATHLMVSEEVARECTDELVLRLLTRIKLEGRAKPVMCYHCMGVLPDAKLKKRSAGGSGNLKEGGSGSDSEGSSDVGTAKTGSTALTGSGGVDQLSDSSGAISDMISARSHESEESGDLLPDNVNLDKLLRWHKKRTACDESTVTFANEFNEAARCVIDNDFAGALKRLQALEADNWIPDKWKTHKSVAILKDLIKMAMQGDGSISASTKLGKSLGVGGQDFFVNVE